MDGHRDDRRRIRSSNILLISYRAVAGEIAKNLVLAGIGSLTIVESDSVTEEDLFAQFSLTDENVGQNVGSLLHDMFAFDPPYSG